MTLREAAQQALKSMDDHMYRADTHEFYEAKESLRAALAEPVQPVMDRDTVVRLAREAGMLEEFHGFFPSMERFAALVAAHEREKHQAQIDFLSRAYDILKKEVDELHQEQRDQIAAAIRSRT